MKNILIPLQFAQMKLPLNWKDLLWAYHENLLTWKDIVQVAYDKVKEGSNISLELELAIVDKDSLWKITDLEGGLIEGCSEDDEVTSRKWLYISLAWLYEKRSEISNPLLEIEHIYADFGYPEIIESFVQYMPPKDDYLPAEHSKEENYLRLIFNWEQYLLSEHSNFN